MGSDYRNRVLELIKLKSLSTKHSDRKIDKVIKALAIDRDDELLGDMEEYLMMKAMPQILEPDPFFPPPKPEEVMGELEIGSVVPGPARFGLNTEQITRNVLILGSVGTGKTSLIIVFIDGLYERSIPFMIPEVAKTKYRNLIRKYPDIQVIRSKDLRFNPLKGPKNTSPQVWMGDFVDAYTHGMDLMLRSKGYLVESIDRAFREAGVYEGSQDNPNMEDLSLILEEKMKTTGFRQDDFILRNIQRIQMLLILTGKIMKCSCGHKIEKLQEAPVIIELGDRNEDVKNFISIMLFTSILRHRMSEGIGGGLRHVLIFDEAKRIFDANLERNYQMGIPTIDLLVSYSREYGQGLILADQEATKLTDSIKANTNCKISFMVGGQEIDEDSKMQGLTEDEKNALMGLPMGHAIVKMDERYPKPFLIKADHIPVEDNVSDEEVDEHSRPFIEHLNRDVRPRSTIFVKKQEKRKSDLSKKAEEWLIHMARNRYMSIAERTKAMGLTNYMANKASKELEIKGYAKKVNVFTGKPGHPIVLMDFLGKGEEFLRSKGEKISKKGKGSIVHQFWQEKIKGYGEARGMEAMIEPNVEGANTDVLLIHPGGARTAVEVALSGKNQVENIKRDLGYFDDVIVAAETKTLAMRIEAEAKKNLSGEDFMKVKFHLLGDFLL